ncbi:MAG: hypothetical protein KAS64_06570 [Spirochaetes bacterium]|nr:hypothetical protein [Spirochaetota bacterium]
MIKSETVMNDTSSRTLELYSSAYTLSDMEIYIFPELLFSLVLANMMSEKLWKWRDDPWFKGILDMPVKQRINRVKQYIMDNYSFNLDLDTWGLTTKDKEIDRFKDFVDIEKLQKSNALFGYEGDKYYFSIDIRRHFGLDKYNSNVIPYWKTETIESMNAFSLKPDWKTGGGECVSLSTLYAAALFVVAGIPLKNIYLMATPLHSQNYIDIDDGVLTNNRRILTKKMFYNGTALTAKARRALENEKVTIISNRGLHIHCLYEEATLPPDVFTHFKSKISDYLKTPFNPEIFGNFIRSHPDFKNSLSYRYVNNGREYYIECEKAIGYEENTKLKISDKSRKKLLSAIDLDEFYPEKIPGRLVVNDLETFIRNNNINIDTREDLDKLHNEFCDECHETCEITKALKTFVHVEAKFPDISSKIFKETTIIDFDPAINREEMIKELNTLRETSIVADLAFHAYRNPQKDMRPFWKAALERNPVSITENENSSIPEIYKIIIDMSNESIYPENRLAMPDEVWNFKTGDGFEKAALFLNILQSKTTPDNTGIVINGSEISIKDITENNTYIFNTKKDINHIDFV